ncbi:hypothetical protein QVD17_34895 [Tagetes erecta]|uniref:Uncharacterized protein n=1 Tax=Tagetes erecta TaxID=13708 RepID=A0AAD8JZX6_TARER|nr:hypothetical protein QVD17_34895 [Tagetes erecta]
MECGGEEHTENIQEETNVIDMPDTDVADAESSQDEEAGSKDVSNPMASIEDRAGALLNIFEAKIETELKKKTSPGENVKLALKEWNNKRKKLEKEKIHQLTTKLITLDSLAELAGLTKAESKDRLETKKALLEAEKDH